MKELLNNCGIYIGPYELSSVANTCELNGESDVVDVTTFGASYRDFLLGLKGVRFAAAGVYDPVVADAALHAEWGLNDQAITFAKANEAGSIAYLLRGCEAQYSVGGTIGSAGIWSLSGQSATPPLIRGLLMHRDALEDTSGDGEGYQAGAALSTQSIYAALHVFAADGTTPELDVIIESSADDTFGSPTTRLTFATAEDVGFQWVQAGPGAITDTWWRVSWTIAGTDPEFGFAVSFGII